MNGLEKAIELLGGVSELARRVGVKQPVVSNWRARKSVPPARCIDIERATDGAVTRYDLRPDIFCDTGRAAA